MALRTELHLSEPGFSGFFQDYPYQGCPQRIAVEVVMLVCSDVRYAHMCSSTRAQYEVKRVQNMKKIDRYKMALRTELHLSDQDFQDYFSGL